MQQIALVLTFYISRCSLSSHSWAFAIVTPLSTQQPKELKPRGPYYGRLLYHGLHSGVSCTFSISHITFPGFASVESNTREPVVDSVCFPIVRIYSARIFFHLYVDRIVYFGNPSLVMRIHTSQTPHSKMLRAKLPSVYVHLYLKTVTFSMSSWDEIQCTNAHCPSWKINSRRL